MITNIKHICLALLCVVLFSVNQLFAAEIKQEKICMTKTPPIEDELIKAESFRNLKPIYVKEEPIIDHTIEQFQSSGKTIKLWAQKRGEKTKPLIEDELITSDFKQKNKTSIFSKSQITSIEDTFAMNSISLNTLSVKKKRNIYDFSKKQVPIELKVLKNSSTKKDITEGSTITFKTVKDVIINGKLLPKGTKVTGRVEMVSESDKMGTPYNIVLDNFKVTNPDKTDPSEEIEFHGTISKSGANRSIWVYPLYQAGNLVLYVAGFAFVPIHGGHAKLSTNETYTVFYETR